MAHAVFVTGGTGYMGSRLIPLLAKRGHAVSALVRPGSENKLPHAAKAVIGNALKLDAYAHAVSGSDTFVHLIGVPNPSPNKASQFRTVDLVSTQVAVKAARDSGVAHIVYLSVAHPAPFMKAYIAVRTECEALVQSCGLARTLIRPWYVLGPGHRWPYLLLPFYWLCEMLPPTRAGAQRLGLVKLDEILCALVWAVENPPLQLQVIDVPRIRALARERQQGS